MPGVIVNLKMYTWHAPGCILLWFNIGRFYPYPSWLLHWHWQWNNNMIARTPVEQPWWIRIRRSQTSATNPQHNHSKTNHNECVYICPDSKVHEANMGPIWGRQDPGRPHIGPMKFAIWVCTYLWDKMCDECTSYVYFMACNIEVFRVRGTPNSRQVAQSRG